MRRLARPWRSEEGEALCGGQRRQKRGREETPGGTSRWSCGGRLSLSTCCFCSCPGWTSLSRPQQACRDREKSSMCCGFAFFSKRRVRQRIPFLDCPAMQPVANHRASSWGPVHGPVQRAGETASAFHQRAETHLAHVFLPSLRKTTCCRAACWLLAWLLQNRVTGQKKRVRYRQRHLLGPVLPCKCSNCCIVPIRSTPASQQCTPQSSLDVAMTCSIGHRAMSGHAGGWVGPGARGRYQLLASTPCGGFRDWRRVARAVIKLSVWWRR
ncbi:hypothetical protein QBC39DRAFT_37266 [Podospora conica]|nr:hypothetical protein QBC39DRAFT_37266 [Schizothecium conicum]